MWYINYQTSVFVWYGGQRKQMTICNATNDFPTKWRLRNKRRNSILMTCHYPDPGTASDWLCHLWNFLQPIESTTSLGSDTSSVWNFCTCFSDFISWRNCWWHREMSSVFSGYCYGWELGHSTVANLNGWNKSLTRCLPSINQSINQSFILTRYIKELKNSFNWNNWGQRDPCYSIICKLKRSEYDYTPGPCLWSCMSGLNELSKTSCIFELCGFLHIFVMFYSIFCLITTTQIRSQRESEPVPYLYLPDEILLQIFSFLSHKDLASCSRVCSQFYRISLDETLCKFLLQKFYKPGLSCSKAG